MVDLGPRLTLIISAIAKEVGEPNIRFQSPTYTSYLGVSPDERWIQRTRVARFV